MLHLPAIKHLDQCAAVSHSCGPPISLLDLPTIEPGEEGRGNERCDEQKWPDIATAEGDDGKHDAGVGHHKEAADNAPELWDLDHQASDRPHGDQPASSWDGVPEAEEAQTSSSTEMMAELMRQRRLEV